MTWFRVDDGFYDHPKVKSLPRGPIRKGAISLWLLAGSWCGRYLTDGMVPAHQVEEFGSNRKDAEALCAADLWHTTGHDCDYCPPVPKGHYLYHQWDEHQPSKEVVERKRVEARIRMQKRRGGGEQTPEPTADVRVMFARTSREVRM